MLPVPDDGVPGDDDLIDIGRSRSIGNLIRMDCRSAHRIGSDDDEVRESSIGDPTAVGPAQTVMAGLAADID